MTNQDIHVHILPCPDIMDGYGLILQHGDKAILVDAIPNVDGLLSIINKHNLTLEAVILTHHHFDHVDGLKDERLQHLPIYGHEVDAHRLPTLSHKLKIGDSFSLIGLDFEVINADGHTMGQVAYLCQNMLFSGDSLMAWGCGRIFEGTPKNMLDTLEHLSTLPEDTLIYSGHNYGDTNGRFALSVEPDNLASQKRLEKIQMQNEEKLPIIPVVLKEEIATNPFLRCDQQALHLHTGTKSKLECFTKLRAMRDNFS